NEVNAAGSIVLTVGQNSLDNTNTFSAAGPSNAIDITYSDDEDVVGEEFDFNNLESSIPVSPIPTTRIHKDYPVSQIIGDLSSTTQTRSMIRVVMTRVVKDQDPLGKFEGKVDEGFLNYDGDAAFDNKEHDFDAKKPESEVILSSSSSAQ
nr:hypothetical protein [Tanacetum cinerariifolium]